jgi:hypothetical protein
MPVNHTRVRDTPRLELVAELGQRRTEFVHTLMRLRERLAIAAATYEAHSLDGANGMLEQQGSIENAIRVLVPDVYRDRWMEWLEYDASLIHTPESPSRLCHLCTMAQAAADCSSVTTAWSPDRRGHAVVHASTRVIAEGEDYFIQLYGSAQRHRIRELAV